MFFPEKQGCPYFKIAYFTKYGSFPWFANVFTCHILPFNRLTIEDGQIWRRELKSFIWGGSANVSHPK